MLKKAPMVSGYARMWPRAVFYTKALNEVSGRQTHTAFTVGTIQPLTSLESKSASRPNLKSYTGLISIIREDVPFLAIVL